MVLVEDFSFISDFKIKTIINFQRKNATPDFPGNKIYFLSTFPKIKILLLPFFIILSKISRQHLL